MIHRALLHRAFPSGVAAALVVACATTQSEAVDLDIQTEAEYASLLSAFRSAEYVRSDYIEAMTKPRVYGVLAGTMAYAERNPLATDAQLASYLSLLDSALQASEPADPDLLDAARCAAALRYTRVEHPSLAGTDTDVNSRALELLGISVRPALNKDALATRMVSFEGAANASLSYRPEVLDLLVTAFFGEDPAGRDRPGLTAAIAQFLAAEGLDPSLGLARPDMQSVNDVIANDLPTWSEYLAARDAGFVALQADADTALDDARGLTAATVQRIAADLATAPSVTESIEITETDPAEVQATLDELRATLADARDERARAAAANLLMLQGAPSTGMGTFVATNRRFTATVFEANETGAQIETGLRIAGNLGLAAFAAAKKDPVTAVSALIPVATDLLSFTGLFDSGPTVEEQLSEISSQIADLGNVMNARFNRIDEQLNLMYGAIVTGLVEINESSGNVDSLVRDMAEVRSSLRRIEDNLYGVVSGFVDVLFTQTVNESLGFRVRSGGENLPYTQADANFVTAMTTLRTFATDLAIDFAGINSPLTPDNADEILGGGTSDFPAFAPQLNALATLPTQFGLPALASEELVGIEPWAQAASAYVQLARENPWYTAFQFEAQRTAFQNDPVNVAEPEIDQIIASGERLEQFFATMRDGSGYAGAPGDTTGSLLFDELLLEYERAATDFKNEINAFIELNYPTAYKSGSERMDLWGNEFQSWPNGGTIPSLGDGILVRVPFVGLRTLTWSNSPPDGGYRIFADAGSAGSDELRWLRLWMLVKRNPLSGSGGDIRLRGRTIPINFFIAETTVYLGPEWTGSASAPESPFRRKVRFIPRDANDNILFMLDEATASAFAGSIWEDAPSFAFDFVRNRTSIPVGSMWCWLREPFASACIREAEIVEATNSFNTDLARRDIQTEFARQRRDLTEQVMSAMANPNSLISQAAAKLDNAEALLDAYVSLALPDALAQSDAIRSALRGREGETELGLRAGDALVLMSEIAESDNVNTWNGPRWADNGFSIRGMNGLLIQRADVLRGEIRKALARIDAGDAPQVLLPDYAAFMLAELRHLRDAAGDIARDDAYAAAGSGTLVVPAAQGLLANDAEFGLRAFEVDTAFVGTAPVGSVTVFADGGFEYTPAPGFSGIDTFTYRATTEIAAGSMLTATSNEATVAIHVGAPPCVADVTTDGSSNGVPDGQVTLSDFSYYLGLWSASDPIADVTTDGTSNGTPDGAVTLSDFSFYLGLWSAGCP